MELVTLVLMSFECHPVEANQLSFKCLCARPSVQTGLVGEASILVGKLCCSLFCENICIIYQVNVPAPSF
jgi:hypothetical protein